ncbi:uroporphyrinogen decarboxylase family protein [Robinsoniella sp. KNHs210]|uniref:uroporphyrinogen decarboxylase family protein n=1 Tax=Robinsoniella sp. KNHs210 TaxID=1469950 RepID=UPI0018CC4651|nr:uroporphyrinogen decarboxylase family protein [Robinsoniella sp. KNHs210]
MKNRIRKGNTMTGRERVINCIKHLDTDRIPHYLELGSEELEKMRQFTGISNYQDSLDNDIDMMGIDGGYTEAENMPGYYMDDFGVCWNRNGADKDIGVIDSCILCEPEDLKYYTFPEIKEEQVREKLKQLAENGKTSFKTASISFSMFERAWTLCGMENLLVFMIEEPDFVHELLGKICDYNCRLIQIALEYDIDGICLGDDWGQQRGMIMGPEKWREFIQPQMKRMYHQIKSAGKYVIQHSCGDIEAVFEDLIEIGLDVYQTFQAEIYDMAKIKKKTGGRLTFWGGISTQTLLPFAEPQEVKDVIIRTAGIMKGNGGYILAPTHAVPGDVPVENIQIMAEIFKNQEKYLV